jgi:hypothetical protein
MPSTVPSKTKLGLPREDVEELLMLRAMFLEEEKSNTEVEEANGFRFLLGEVRYWKPFQDSFDRLVSKGCSPYILLHGLYYLLKAEQKQAAFQLPEKREIRSLETRLRKAVKSILAFEREYEEAHRLMVFSHFSYGQNAGPEELDFYMNRRDLPSQAQNPCLTQKMLGYAEMLRAWWTPRADALKTHAAVHNLLYTEIVTGEPQFPLIAEMNSGFLGGDPIEPATLGKNLSRFKKRNKKFHSTLVRQLQESHCLVRPVEPFNWALWRSDIKDKSK